MGAKRTAAQVIRPAGRIAVACSTPVRPLRRDLQAPPRQGPPERGRRRRGPARDPRRPARGRRQLHASSRTVVEPHPGAACVGAELLQGLSPASRSSRSSTRSWSTALGGETLKITYAPRPPTVVLMAGLQGSGKTTNAAKLARWFKQQGRNPLLVGADLQRPAAVEQLRTLGRQIDVPVFSEPGDPVEHRRAGPRRGPPPRARRRHRRHRRPPRHRRRDDGPGPPHLRARSQPELHVPRRRRHDRPGRRHHGRGLPPDARPSTASSCPSSTATPAAAPPCRSRRSSGGPIAFASTGEKLDDFEQFHPDRMASRILGMGDVLTLIEKAEQVYEKDQAEKAAARLMEGEFTLDDFLEQMQQLKKMGPLSSIIGMLPGIPKELKNAKIDDDELKPVEAIIHSMTLEERRRPELINGSRRLRIANGSGTTTGEVNRLVKQFQEMQKMMKRMGGLGTKKMKKKGKRPRHDAAPAAARVPRPELGDDDEAMAVKLRLDADGQDEAADLPGGGGRQPLAPRRPVHRDRRASTTPAASRRWSTIDNDKALKWLRKGAQPTERVAEAAGDLGRLGRVQGQRERLES